VTQNGCSRNKILTCIQRTGNIALLITLQNLTHLGYNTEMGKQILKKLVSFSRKIILLKYSPSRIYSSHRGDYEEFFSLLGYNAV
jgi:hypothetical protein